MLALPALAADRVSRGAKLPTIPSQRGADDQVFHSEVRLRAFAGATRHERAAQATPCVRTGRFQQKRSRRADKRLALPVNIFRRDKPQLAVHPPLTPPAS